MLQSTIGYVKGLPDDEFRYLFSRVTGWISAEAEANPGATCRLDEVAELFNVLSDRMHDKEYETPAAGTAGESR